MGFGSSTGWTAKRVWAAYDANRRGAMHQRPKRETVDLSQYPDLVVIYLGMRVNALTGFRTLFGFGPEISAAVEAKPDGLLLHENLLFSLRHFGMRQYWRDFESLEAWSRSEPHRQWWQEFLRDSGGTGFLARNPFSAWRHRSGVRGHEIADRAGAVCSGRTRAWCNVLGAEEGRCPWSGETSGSGNGGGVLLTVAG